MTSFGRHRRNNTIETTFDVFTDWISDVKCDVVAQCHEQQDQHQQRQTRPSGILREWIAEVFGDGAVLNTPGFTDWFDRIPARRVLEILEESLASSATPYGLSSPSPPSPPTTTTTANNLLNRYRAEILEELQTDITRCIDNFNKRNREQLRDEVRMRPSLHVHRLKNLTFQTLCEWEDPCVRFSDKVSWIHVIQSIARNDHDWKWMRPGNAVVVCDQKAVARQSQGRAPCQAFATKGVRSLMAGVEQVITAGEYNARGSAARLVHKEWGLFLRNAISDTEKSLRESLHSLEQSFVKYTGYLLPVPYETQVRDTIHSYCGEWLQRKAEDRSLTRLGCLKWLRDTSNNICDVVVAKKPLVEVYPNATQKKIERLNQLLARKHWLGLCRDAVLDLLDCVSRLRKYITDRSPAVFAPLYHRTDKLTQLRSHLIDQHDALRMRTEQVEEQLGQVQPKAMEAREELYRNAVELDSNLYLGRLCEEILDSIEDRKESNHSRAIDARWRAILRAKLTRAVQEELQVVSKEREEHKLAAFSAHVDAVEQKLCTNCIRHHDNNEPKAHQHCMQQVRALISETQQLEHIDNPPIAFLSSRPPDKAVSPPSVSNIVKECFIRREDHTDIQRRFTRLLIVPTLEKQRNATHMLSAWLADFRALHEFCTEQPKPLPFVHYCKDVLRNATALAAWLEMHPAGTAAHGGHTPPAAESQRTDE